MVASTGSPSSPSPSEAWPASSLNQYLTSPSGAPVTTCWSFADCEPAEFLNWSLEFNASCTALAHSSDRYFTPTSHPPSVLARASDRPDPGRTPGEVYRLVGSANPGASAAGMPADTSRRGEQRGLGEVPDVVEEAHLAAVAVDQHAVDRRVLRQEEHVVPDAHHVAEVRVDDASVGHDNDGTVAGS